MREFLSTACRVGLLLGNSVQHRALASWKDLGHAATENPFWGQRRSVEKLWQKFFSNPSQWWDHRLEKENERYPDFKHKNTQEALWLDGKLNPPWVEAGLNALAPGAVQCNIFSWNKQLSRLAKAGQYEKVMQLFLQIQREGIIPDRLTFIPVLSACAGLQALQVGRQIHSQIKQSGLESNMYVSSSLLDMYAKCGSIEDAWMVFNKMSFRDVVAWNAMILGCVKCGQGHKALELYQQMQQEGVEPVSVTFVGILNGCASTFSLDEGRTVHDKIIQKGCESDVYVGSSLIDMYSKCGSIDDAFEVFNKMPKRDVVSWNTMILGYVKCGDGQKALDLFQKMKMEFVEPDRITFVGVLNACASVVSLEIGKSVHEEIKQRGLDCDGFVGNSLIDMYTKCGSIDEASSVFDNMPLRDVVSWNAMILGNVKCGQGQRALELCKQMEQEQVIPVPMTFVGMLNACASVGALDEGRRVHAQVSQLGYESDVFVGSSLVDMYAKCGSIEDASKVFNRIPKRDVVAWNAMILGLVKCGKGQRAMELCHVMEKEGVVPVHATFVAKLNACASIGALDEGRHVHNQIVQSGLEFDLIISGSLVDMYSKCGCIADAANVFNLMPTRNIVSWNAMLLGYVKCGQGQKALDLFQRMDLEGVEPVPITFVGLLNACASVLDLTLGRLVHKQIIQKSYESDVFVGSSLVDMYCKCGSIDDAWNVFNKMPIRNVVSWNSMILGYAKHGQGLKALDLFRDMQGEVEPDHLTFIGLLNACASISALEQGRYIHQLIIQSGYESDVFVGSSLVDMYCKCGNLEDARRQFNKMPTRDMVSWNAMLGGYAMHGKAMDSLAHFEQMREADVEIDDVTFVSLLSACSHAGLVDEGQQYFEYLSSSCRISLNLNHYGCAVDLLGRAGRLHEAEDLVKNISFELDASVWMSLLGSCRFHGNVEMGERIAQNVLEFDQVNAAGYVALSSM